MENAESSLPLLIRELEKRLRVGFETYLRQVHIDDLKPREGRVLFFVLQHEGCSSFDIQQAFDIAKSSVSEILKTLCVNGFIEYSTSELDHREKTIRITKKGIAYEKRVEEAVIAFDKQAFKGISKEETLVMTEGLLKIIDNVKEVLENG